MLTVKYLDGKLNKSQEKEIVKAHRYGLSARIRKTGSISFIFRYKWLDKQERITIGTYPEISITQASDVAKKYQALIAENKNPKREMIKTKLEQDQEYTVKRLLDEWWLDYFRDHPDQDKRHSYPGGVKQGLEDYIYKPLGKYPWDLVERKTWTRLLQELKYTAPSIAQRMVTCVKSAASYGISHGIIKEHPLTEFTAKKNLGISNKKITRTLNNDEIFKVYEAINTSRLKPGNKILFELMIIYGCRTIELRLCKPEHLDFKNGVWTVPSEIAKPKDKKSSENRRPIRRPLFKETIELFEKAIKLSRNSAYVFPKENGQPLSPSSMLDIPGRLTGNINKAYPDYKMEHWTKHDLRRTVRTNMSRLTSRDVSETMLGHVLPGEQSTYDHYDYLEEQLIAYQKWYMILDNIWNQRDNVTVLGKRKGA